MMSVSLVSDRNVSICASQESIMHYLSKHTPSRHIHDVWKPTGAIEVTHPLEASKGVCVGQRVNENFPKKFKIAENDLNW